MREAKKKYFNELAGNRGEITPRGKRSTLSKGHTTVNNNWPPELTPDAFNNHFVSVASEFLENGQSDGSQYTCFHQLLTFRTDRTSQSNSFSIPFLSVFEAGEFISKMDNKKSTGCDGISVQLLKTALAYIIDTSIYIQFMHTEKRFPDPIQKG